MQLLNEHNAYRYVLDNLTKLGYKFNSVISINQNRYTIAKGTKNILILFKRELYYSFGVMHKEQGAEGAGETINVEQLKIAKQQEVEEIFMVHPDGKIYNMNLDIFLRDSIRWHNKEGKDVRSISIKAFTRVAADKAILPTLSIATLL